MDQDKTNYIQDRYASLYFLTPVFISHYPNMGSNLSHYSFPYLNPISHFPKATLKKLDDLDGLEVLIQICMPLLPNLYQRGILLEYAIMHAIHRQPQVRNRVCGRTGQKPHGRAPLRMLESRCRQFDLDRAIQLRNRIQIASLPHTVANFDHMASISNTSSSNV